jgi:16S rRNA processing protein RimM
MSMDDEKDTGAAATADGGEFVTIARVIRTQGRKGEVSAILLTDFPERFDSRRQLFLLDMKGARRAMNLEDHWFHKGHVVLKFAGIDSISDGETLKGSEVQVPFSERVPLAEGEVYVSDLVGCAVYDGPREIGRIRDVQFGSGEAPLLVIAGDKEYLVPFATVYTERIDVEHKRVELKLPAGMLELDAPLNEEERKRQQNSED